MESVVGGSVSEPPGGNVAEVVGRSKEKVNVSTYSLALCVCESFFLSHFRFLSFQVPKVEILLYAHTDTQIMKQIKPRE